MEKVCRTLTEYSVPDEAVRELLRVLLAASSGDEGGNCQRVNTCAGNTTRMGMSGQNFQVPCGSGVFDFGSGGISLDRT